MNEKTQPCTHCGAMHPRVNLTWMGSAELCPECLQRYTVCCDCCGERIWMANDYGTHYLHLCASCRADNYVTCENCGALIPQEDAHYNDEYEAYCDSCYERGYGGTIHNYSYKPEPIFYGDGPLYLGVELEVDEAGKDNINAVQALRAFNQENVYGYVKSDGSLNDGFELVTHPCTLETHLQQVPWRETLEALRGMGYRSHAPGTCGLHVHVSRKALGKDVYEQEETIAKLLYIFERFWQEILRFSRRTESQINHWAARYGYKDCGEEILKEAKHGANGRYACINLTNTDTIEFRVFRGTLKYNTVIATLQFVANLCRVAISLPEYRIQEFSWPALIEALTQDNCPELVQYLKERNLYVNEPVTAEREV